MQLIVFISVLLAYAFAHRGHYYETRGSDLTKKLTGKVGSFSHNLPGSHSYVSITRDSHHYHHDQHDHHPLPDCKWSNWENSTDCLGTCGYGKQTWTRKKIQHHYHHPPPVHTFYDSPVHTFYDDNNHYDHHHNHYEHYPHRGYQKRSASAHHKYPQPPPQPKECHGENKEDRVCTLDPCPIDCTLGEWTKWSKCPSCGEPTQTTRTRKIINKAQFGGSCWVTSETRDCNNPICPVDCEWSKFEPSTPCSVSCGNGTQNFTRKKNLHQHVPTLCDPPYDYQHLGYNKRSASQYHQPSQPCSAINHVAKECHGGPIEKRICTMDPCPINCELSKWTDWTECPTCGDPTQSTRFRVIEKEAQFGGICDTNRYQTRDCNNPKCPVKCKIGLWSEWSGCSSTCGPNAKNTRTRRILEKAQHGGTCPYVTVQVDTCRNRIPCFNCIANCPNIGPNGLVSNNRSPFLPFEIPLMEITLPNGNTSNMILGRHQLRERNFIGRLEGESHACIAVTLHDDENPFYWSFTILYNEELDNTMFHWFPESGETQVIREPFSPGSESDDVTDTIEDDNIASVRRRKRQVPQEVPLTAKLQVKVGYDTKMLEFFKMKFGTNVNVHEKIVKYWQDSENHIQTRFCLQNDGKGNRNVGSRIKVERIDFDDDVDFKPYDVSIFAENKDDMEAMEKYTGEDLKTADLMVYMAYDERGSRGTIGRANLQSVCKPLQKEKAHTICEWHTANAAFASMVAHEIAHTLGIFHDFDERNEGTGFTNSNPKCESDSNIMSYGTQRELWSQCSIANFKQHYNDVQDDWCMDLDIGENVCTGETAPPKRKPRIKILGPRFVDGIAVDGEVIINNDVKPNPFLTEFEVESPNSEHYEDQRSSHSSGSVSIF